MTLDKKIIIFLLFLLVVIGGFLVYSISLDDVTYYRTVNEVLAEPAKYQKKDIRVMGLVQKGSVKWRPESLTLSFKITEDGLNFLNIDFKGVKPDLFKEGQGVVVEGKIEKNFKAHNLLVKHSPEYRVLDHDSRKEEYYKSLIKNL